MKIERILMISGHVKKQLANVVTHHISQVAVISCFFKWFLVQNEENIKQMIFGLLK